MTIPFGVVHTYIAPKGSTSPPGGGAALLTHLTCASIHQAGTGAIIGDGVPDYGSWQGATRRC